MSESSVHKLGWLETSGAAYEGVLSMPSAGPALLGRAAADGLSVCFQAGGTLESRIRSVLEGTVRLAPQAHKQPGTAALRAIRVRALPDLILRHGRFPGQEEWNRELLTPGNPWRPMIEGTAPLCTLDELNLQPLRDRLATLPQAPAMQIRAKVWAEGAIKFAARRAEEAAGTPQRRIATIEDLPPEETRFCTRRPSLVETPKGLASHYRELSR